MQVRIFKKKTKIHKKTTKPSTGVEKRTKAGAGKAFFFIFELELSEFILQDLSVFIFGPWNYFAKVDRMVLGVLRITTLVLGFYYYSFTLKRYTRIHLYL